MNISETLSFCPESLENFSGRPGQVSKASRKLQQRFDKCQKLPANCSNELATAKSFLQIAAKNWQLPKASRKLQQRIGNCQKLPADCSNELAVAKSLMQIAAKNWQLPKASCKLRQRIGSFDNHQQTLFALYPIISALNHSRHPRKCIFLPENLADSEKMYIFASELIMFHYDSNRIQSHADSFASDVCP